MLPFFRTLEHDNEALVGGVNMGYKIVFQPSGMISTIVEGETILKAAQRAGVEIEAYCGGAKRCGKCKIKLVEGRFDGHGIESSKSNLVEISDVERKLLSDKEIKENYRLACVTTVKGDVVIEIPRESQGTKQVILEDGSERKTVLNPAVKTYYLKLEKPSLEDKRDDFSRITDALKSQYKELNKQISIDFKVLQSLSHILRESNWEVTVFLLYDQKIIKVAAGEVKEVYGVAIDIGTTTVAAYLCELKEGSVRQTASMMNPQIRYGDDVLARISYCSGNEDGLSQLQGILVEGLNELIEKMCQQEKIEMAEVVEGVLVFNTVMEHIALKLPPQYIGVAPFTSTVAKPLDLVPEQVGVHILPSGNIHCLPSEAGFVGADNVAVLIAEEPYKEEKMKLIIDIGTNSEICLGNREKLYTTSCATGPALEGAQIKCGMRAAKGAIEGVKINIHTLEPTLRIIGNGTVPVGICGSGIIDAVAQMAKVGIIEPNGKFSKQLAGTNRIRADEKGKNEYVLYFKQDEDEHDIVVTQKDVRAVQLAKAALYAGARALMKRAGVEKVDEVILAGAFGSYIDKENALTLGLFPDCPLNQVIVSGNAAGVGARLALLNIEKRKEAAQIARAVECIETATDVDFQMAFAKAMSIPHEKDTFTSNMTYAWKCKGIDKRELPEAVLQQGTSALFNAKEMKVGLECLKVERQTSYLRMPLMQNVEAIAYGSSVKQIGCNYIPGDYRIHSLEELKNLGEMPYKTGILKEVLDCISESKDQNVILDVEGPFAIVAALMDPIKLYSCVRKNGDVLKEVLEKIADSLADYVIEAVHRGVKIISFAEPEGVMQLVGEKFYKTFVGPTSIRFFNKVVPHLDKAIIHICGKTSYSLVKGGYMVVKPFRIASDRDYVDVLLDYAENKNFKIIGHGCINNKNLREPIINRLEIAE